VIELEEIYVPKKLLQPYTNHLQINDSGSEHIFTTDKQNNGKETYVSDPNLLCRYAAGRATFGEVLEIAQRPQKDTLADEIAQLKRELDILSTEKAEVRGSYLQVANALLLEQKKVKILARYLNDSVTKVWDIDDLVKKVFVWQRRKKIQKLTSLFHREWNKTNDEYRVAL
jgi:predicted RNA-binding protein YlxR (DUF448 family)